MFLKRREWPLWAVRKVLWLTSQSIQYESKNSANMQNCDFLSLFLHCKKHAALHEGHCGVEQRIKTSRKSHIEQRQQQRAQHQTWKIFSGGFDAKLFLKHSTETEKSCRRLWKSPAAFELIWIIALFQRLVGHSPPHHRRAQFWNRSLSFMIDVENVCALYFRGILSSVQL